jgi:hypothetical protein
LWDSLEQTKVEWHMSLSLFQDQLLAQALLIVAHDSVGAQCHILRKPSCPFDILIAVNSATNLTVVVDVQVS